MNPRLAIAFLLGALLASCGPAGDSEVRAAEAPGITLHVLGGSIAWGEPYSERADLGRIVSWILEERLDGRRVGVENHGGPGRPSTDVVDDARALAATRPAPGTAVAILSLGGNEFLRFDSLEELIERGRTLFDEPTVVPAVRETVLATYAKNIDTILSVLGEAGIEVVAVTVAVNERDWEPNRSVLADPAHAGAVRAHLETVERARAAGDAAAALEAARAILRLEPGFALASQRAGDALRELGRLEEARAAYQDAIDHDGNPYRETSAQTRLLEEACARHGVPVVDARARLAAATPDGLIGFEWMWDNCHPVLAGYARIAAGVAEALAARHGAAPRAVDLAALERDLGFDDAYRAQVLAGRGKYCYVSSTLTYDPRARLARSKVYLDQARALAPKDPELLCSLAVRSALAEENEQSLAYWREAFALDPRATRQRAKHPYVQQVLKRRGLEDLLGMLKSGS